MAVPLLVDQVALAVGISPSEPSAQFYSDSDWLVIT
jgi:hypothetical protein